MAIQCKYCGTELPTDDARFCNNCGMLVPSHPFSPQSLSALKSSGTRFPFSSSLGGQQEGQAEQDRDAAREESSVELDSSDLAQEEEKLRVEGVAGVAGVAEKLPETPKPEVQKKAASSSGVAYKQMTPLASPRQIPGVRRKISGPIQLSPASSAWPAPLTYVSAKESPVPEKEKVAEQKENAPGKREFHVGVWEDEEMRELTDEERESIESLPTRSVAAVSVEDAPTREVVVAAEDAPTREVAVAVEDAPTREVAVAREDQLSTLRQGPEQVPSSPYLSVPSSQTVAQELLVEDWRVRSRAISGSVDPSLAPLQPNAAPFVSSASYQPVDMPRTSMGERDGAVSAAHVRRSGRRWPVVVVLVVVVLVVLAAGGVGAFMLLSPPSSGNPLVQAQVSFTDSQLGISLLYPNGWIKQVDAATATAHFYASNHIGQVDITVAASSGNVKQAVQQQATKMGLSVTKAGATLNFAGASWQQLQGTLQQSGVTYTDTILATVHGGKLFMIVQQAPQTNYADWEKAFFAPLRASLAFL